MIAARSASITAAHSAIAMSERISSRTAGVRDQMSTAIGTSGEGGSSMKAIPVTLDDPVEVDGQLLEYRPVVTDRGSSNMLRPSAGYADRDNTSRRHGPAVVRFCRRSRCW